MAQDKAPRVREKGKEKTEIEIQDSLDASWVQVFSHSQNIPRNNAFSPPLGLSVPGLEKSSSWGHDRVTEQLRKFKRTQGFFLESLVPTHVRMCIGESEY